LLSPVTPKIVGIIVDTLKEAKKQQKLPNRIILAGGFSESLFLQVAIPRQKLFNVIAFRILMLHRQLTYGFFSTRFNKLWNPSNFSHSIPSTTTRTTTESWSLKIPSSRSSKVPAPCDLLLVCWVSQSSYACSCLRQGLFCMGCARVKSNLHAKPGDSESESCRLFLCTRDESIHLNLALKWQIYMGPRLRSRTR